MRNVIITGATGFLGSYLAIELLSTSDDVHLYCLVRPSGGRASLEPEDRLLARLHRSLIDSGYAAAEAKAALERWRHRLHVVPSELPDPELSARPPLSGVRVDEVWHVAGLMHFAERHRAAVHKTNVEGTRSLLRQLPALGTPVFNYVSTAYVAGTASGEIAEAAANLAVPANNPYEESKRIAEQDVVAACAEHGARFRIFRPSIVVGDSRTHKADSNVGLYGFLTLLERVRDDVEDRLHDYFRQHPLRLLVAPDASLNLICVDHVAKLMVKVARSASTERYFHIASARTTTLIRASEMVFRATGMRVDMVTREQELNPIDLALHRQAQIFRCYLGPEKRFRLDHALSAAGVGPEATVHSEDDGQRMVDEFYRSHREAKKQKRSSVESVVRRLDRRELHDHRSEPLVYLAGGTGPETVVIVNAYGQSPAFWNALAGRWLPDRKVLVVLPRGTGGELGAGATFKFEDQVADLRRVLSAEGPGPYHVVAWCTGPKVALRLCAESPENLASLSLVTGAFRGFRGTEAFATEYESNMEPLCQMVVEEPERAGFVMEALRAILTGDAGRNTVEQTHVSELLSLISNTVKPLVIAPFLREASVVNYAHQLLDFWSRDLTDDLPRVNVPTLFIAAENDRIASPGISYEVARRLKSASFVNIRGGNHYCMHDTPELVGDLIETFWKEPKMLEAYREDVTFSA